MYYLLVNMSRINNLIFVTGLAVSDAAHAQDDQTKKVDTLDAADAQKNKTKNTLVAIAEEYYNKDHTLNNTFWVAPYLCRYNLSHQASGVITDCDSIQPEERVLLPSQRVLYCNMLKDLDLTCPLPSLESFGEGEREAIEALNPTQLQCFQQLYTTYPEAPPSLLINFTAAILKNSDEGRKNPTTACTKMLRTEMQQVFRLPPDCYVTIGSEGKIKEFTEQLGCSYYKQ